MFGLWPLVAGIIIKEEIENSDEEVFKPTTVPCQKGN
jgi:hypothetical protein